MAQFEMFETVRIAKLPKNYDKTLRPPQIGDLGVIVMCYGFDGYGVEGIGEDYSVAWYADFSSDELDHATNP